MADYEDIKSRIITSVFNKRRQTTGVAEFHVCHQKIWEDTDDGVEKPRYILLSRTENNQGNIHKAKLNENGTFSVGKTWPLSELRGVEIINNSVWAISFARTYKWQSDNASSQTLFTTSLVKLFRELIGNQGSLRVIGVTEAAPTRATPSPRTPARSPANGSSAINGDNPQRGTPSRPSGVLSPPPTQSQNRAPSPSQSGSPSQNLPAARPRPQRPRALSNSQSRLSTSTTYSTVPDVALPSSPTPARPPPPQIASKASYGENSYGRRSAAEAGPSEAPSRRPATNGSQARSNGGSPEQERTRPPRNNDATPARTPPTMSRVQSSKSEGKEGTGTKRPDPNARVSFFDLPNQAALDRLITGDLLVEGGGEGDVVEGESVREILGTVEEILDGHEWPVDIRASGATSSAPGSDQVEAQLLTELLALEKANIYSILESDDRIGTVLEYIDKAVSELDSMDILLSSYKMHLNTVTDDISHIQGQNRGLQVQTQNQKALLSEVENLLQMVQVDRDALTTLTRDSLRDPAGIERLEIAATQLYKALQAGRDRDMAATMERLGEYQTYNSQFSTRILDFLSVLFTSQGATLLSGSDGVMEGPRGRPVVVGHKDMEVTLGRYAGLLLYLREMDEQIYGRVCANYFSSISGVHSKQVKALLAAYEAAIRKSPEDDADLAVTPTSSGFRPGLRRAGTMMRLAGQGRKDRDKGGASDGDMRPADAFAEALESIAPLIYAEEEFIADFLQINDAGLTFADYMGMENYYRRQASRAAGLQPSTIKLVRGAMDLIFGFLPMELKSWIETILARDGLQVIGITAVLERFLVDAEERGRTFLFNLLEKQHARLKILFNNHVNDQIKLMESIKVSSKKRGGTAPFIKMFPAYIARVESQLAGVNNLEIRASVDAAYDRIVTRMFELLRQMAKLDGSEGEDKGQMNYHVILIENMHNFVAEMAQVQLGAVSSFAKRAEAIYEENLQAYVKLLFRKPFAKIIDYFDGVERLLKTTAPSEVSSNSSYNKSALKKVVKEYNAKDIRKHIDSLSRRVEKQFTDVGETKALADGDRAGAIAPGTVLVGVWKACEDEMLRATEEFNKRIAQCYSDSGVKLEYTAGDVEAAFKKHRVGA